MRGKQPGHRVASQGRSRIPSVAGRPSNHYLSPAAVSRLHATTSRMLEKSSVQLDAPGRALRHRLSVASAPSDGASRAITIHRDGTLSDALTRSRCSRATSARFRAAAASNRLEVPGSIGYMEGEQPSGAKSLRAQPDVLLGEQIAAQ